MLSDTVFLQNLFIYLFPLIVILIWFDFFSSNQDLTKWAEGKHEIEIVDMILKLKQKRNLCNETSTGIKQLKDEIKEQLLKHLETMKSSLPDDLKIILNNTT